MPKKIPTHRAKVGDTLAEPVVHGAGQMLLVKGTRLERQHLDMMRQRGVLLVTVVDENAEVAASEATPPVEMDPERMRAIVLEEAKWFGDARKDPVMAEVFRWLIQYRARGLTERGQHA